MYLKKIYLKKKISDLVIKLYFAFLSHEYFMIYQRKLKFKEISGY